MQTTTLVFPYNVRLTYTAIRAWFQQKQTQFSSIEYNDSLNFWGLPRQSDSVERLHQQCRL